MTFKLLFNIIGVLASIAMLVCWIIGIWNNDTRWGGTGACFAPVAFAGYCVASFQPAKKGGD